jgi:putative FmdB family regulatory protein
MPSYEYRCQACNRTVTLRLSITQHEKARQTCPKCGSTKLTQLMSSFLTQTSRKA